MRLRWAASVILTSLLSISVSTLTNSTAHADSDSSFTEAATYNNIWAKAFQNSHRFFAYLAIWRSRFTAAPSPSAT